MIHASLIVSLVYCLTSVERSYLPSIVGEPSGLVLTFSQIRVRAFVLFFYVVLFCFVLLLFSFVCCCCLFVFVFVFCFFLSFFLWFLFLLVLFVCLFCGGDGGAQTFHLQANIHGLFNSMDIILYFWWACITIVLFV